MQSYADLEIGLQFQEIGNYAVDFRFHLPESETDVRSLRAKAQIEAGKFAPFIPGSEEYGQALTEALFKDPELAQHFGEALALCENQGLAIRMRLVIDPRAEELHAVRWEALRNPSDGRPLCSDENILFSRYLPSLDYRQIRLRHKSRMNALALVANPVDLAAYKLAPIDGDAEVASVRANLAGIPVTVLGGGGDEAATLANLVRLMRQQSAPGTSKFDIVYLVAHGSLQDDESWLWLEDEEGKATRVSGRELVTRVKELNQTPLLVVLASCESAGNGEGRALSALGPRLAEAGVPAVIAMQGKISIETSTKFTQSFFETLQRDGVIDHAANVARGKVREQQDYWMPALFMRLRSGRIWYTPGFEGEESDIGSWESLRTFIQEALCTAILGPELSEPLIGQGREIALQWADSHAYPLHAEDRDDLARVAQYLATQQGTKFIYLQYRNALRQAILERFPTALSQELRTAEAWREGDLLQALEKAARAQWDGGAENPYRLLAELGLRIYITTEQGDLLKNALIEAGLQPEARMCPWNGVIRRKKALWFYDDDPTPENPLVYHLYGHFSEPASLLFTEDDYFDYLINMTEHRDLIPDSVSAALADSALLFLGFRLEDWQFRVFFRLIMNQPGVEGLQDYSHVAAQIAPMEGLIEDTERARRFMQRYLQRKWIDIYWGTSADFLQDLAKRM